MISEQIIILNPAGLHARPANQFCCLSRRYQSKITLHFGSRIIDAKNILGVMSSCIKTGATLTIACDGDDEQLAMHSILEYFEQFNA